MLCSLSQLTPQQMNEIQALETDLNLKVLAFSCHDAEPKTLDKDTLDKIQAVEKKLGVSLVAVN
ncbi:MAG: hypothetical protein MI747_18535 [Desulfobacterales bacterium]|nr:hypothetical protein [Desulfobacterales bacterium]